MTQQRCKDCLSIGPRVLDCKSEYRDYVLGDWPYTSCTNSKSEHGLVHKGQFACRLFIQLEEIPIWKVVKEQPGRALISAIIRYDGRVTCVMGEWARAPQYLAKRGYHLCGFKTRRDAVIFRDNGEHHVIYQALARGIIEWLPPSLSAAADRKSTIDAAVDIGSWPRGTIMAKEIKLLERG